MSHFVVSYSKIINDKIPSLQCFSTIVRRLNISQKNYLPFTCLFHGQNIYLPASRSCWLSLYHRISVLGLESSAVHASSIKFPAITGVGFFNLTLLGGTMRKRNSIDKQQHHWVLTNTSISTCLYYNSKDNRFN